MSKQKKSSKKVAPVMAPPVINNKKKEPPSLPATLYVNRDTDGFPMAFESADEVLSTLDKDSVEVAVYRFMGMAQIKATVVVQVTGDGLAAPVTEGQEHPWIEPIAGE